MKRIKVILPLIAFAIALFASAFTVKHSAHKTAASLYWYTVTYDAQHPSGYIPSSSSFYTQDDKANVSSPCSAGITKDCLRGFASQLSTFPSSSMGDDQIKKP